MMLKVELSKQSEGKAKAFIKAVKAKSERGAKMLVRGMAMEIEGEAKENAPVGTPESTGIKGYVGGALKQSGRYQIAPSGLSARVEFTVKYAAAQEYGWTTVSGSRVQGKFYLRKGVKAGMEWLEKNKSKALSK